MLSSETKRRIDSCRDILVGQLPLPTDQVELITLALIYKFMDDLDEQSVQLGGKRSFFIKDLADFRWRSLMPQTVSAADRVRLFADGLEALGDPKTGKHLPEMFRDIFRNAMLKFRDGRILSLFLTELDGFAYSHSEELGNAFEYLLQSMGAQGENGQFRTPRHIINFIVEVLEPKPEDKILDPACGTGGFLVSAYKHILGKHTSKGSSVPGDQLSPAKKEKLTQHLNGYDITPMMVKLSKVNMFLHGFSDPQIHEYDTLSNDARWNEKYDLIMANPPFMTPKGGVVPHTKFRIAAKKAEVLFSDYIAEHLTTNGRAGIIVPEGIIFQSATAYKALRKFLVEDSLVAVIALPSGVFNPYSGVKTSILILDKGLAHKADSIAFFKVENDGYDLGAQRRPIDKNDLPRLTREIHEYLEKLRTGKKLTDKDGLLLVSKEKVAASGEYNLGAERHRETSEAQGGWPLARLDQICLQITDGSHFSPETHEAGFPYVTVKDLSQGRVDLAGCKKINEKSYQNLVSNGCKPRRGDILFSKDGTVGKTALVEFDDDFVVLSSLAIISPNTSLALAPYLYVIMSSTRFVDTAIERKTGVAIKRIVLRTLKEIHIPLPPLEIQKEIVAEIEGYQKVIDGARAVVENYKPQIAIDPKWPMKPLGHIAEILMGQSPAGETYNNNGNGVPLINGPVEFGPEPFSKTVITQYTTSPTKMCQVGDLILCVRGSTLGRMNIAGYSGCIGRGVAVIRSGSSQSWINHLVNSYRDKIFKLGVGSTFPNISSKDLADLAIPLPPVEVQGHIIKELEKEQAMVDANKDLIVRFEKKIQAVMDRVWGNGAAE